MVTLSLLKMIIRLEADNARLASEANVIEEIANDALNDMKESERKTGLAVSGMVTYLLTHLEETLSLLINIADDNMSVANQLRNILEDSLERCPEGDDLESDNGQDDTQDTDPSSSSDEECKPKNLKFINQLAANIPAVSRELEERTNRQHDLMAGDVKAFNKAMTYTYQGTVVEGLAQKCKPKSDCDGSPLQKHKARSESICI